MLIRQVRAGRRGRALLFFAGLDLVFAFSLAYPDHVSGSTPLLTWLATVAPLWVWAAAWLTAGLLCGFYAFRRKDQWGFTAAITIKVLWGVTCLGGWLVGGVDRGYVSAVVWLSFAALVWTLAGWPEPDGQRGPTWTPPSG